MGKFLETHQMANSKYKISGELKKAFKGLIQQLFGIIVLKNGRCLVVLVLVDLVELRRRSKIAIETLAILTTTLEKLKQKNASKMLANDDKPLTEYEQEYVKEIKLIKSKKDIILEAGRYLENNLEIVKNNSPNNICQMIKQKFKGIINPTNIWYYCPEKWKNQSYASTGRIGGLEAQKRLKNSSVSKEEEPLTEYEQKFVEVHDEKVNRNEHIVALIELSGHTGHSGHTPHTVQNSLN